MQQSLYPHNFLYILVSLNPNIKGASLRNSSLKIEKNFLISKYRLIIFLASSYRIRETNSLFINLFVALLVLILIHCLDIRFIL
jgi:hypothetical protein